MSRIASLVTFVEYLGESATARLIAHFGGRQIKIPVTRSGKTWGGLVMALGEEGAAKLIENFRGEALYIPKNDADEVRARHAEVKARLANGEKPADISRDMTYTARYSERWIRAIAAREEQSPQGRLFA